MAYTFIPMSGKMEFNHQYNIACLYLSFNLIKNFQVAQSKDSINRLIKKIEESETALVLPALSKIRGRIIRNDGKDFTGLSPEVIIDTLNIDL